MNAKYSRPVCSLSIYPCSLLVLSLVASVSAVSGQDASPQDPARRLEPEAGAELPPLFQEFSQALTNVILAGHFTIDRSTEPPREERYEIHRVTKAPKGDYWLFQARIKYGQYDVTLPLPLEVKWAEKTPVITLDNVTIPGLGTFNARVLIDGDRYAGTWTHGEVGGHMFGKIEKNTRRDQTTDQR